MKCFVIIGLFLIILTISLQNKVAEEITKNYFKSHEDIKKHCLIDISVDIKLENIFENTGEIKNDESLKCFAKCLLITSGALNEAGDIFPANMVRNMQLKDPTVINGVMEKCSGFDKTDLCNGAKELIDCTYKYLEAHL